MRATATLAVFAAAACSDQSTGITAPSGPQQSVAVALVPGILIGADSNPVTVARGTFATVNVRVTRVSGFTGAITLSADTAGVARGVRVTLPNTSIAAGDTSSRLVTITVDTTATASTTPTNVRIIASGSGVTSQTLLMGVIVVNQTAGFTVAQAGTTTGSTVQIGQTGTVRLVLRRTGGFTGPVTFVADSAGLPRGLTVTQGATVGDTVTLNLAVGSTATAGNFTVNLRGSGTGVTAQTFPLALTIQPGGGFSIGGGTTATAASGVAGTTVVLPLRINRTGGFGQRVVFTTSGAPTGVTTSFDSTATGATDSTTTLRITLPATLAAGTYPITIRGNSAGLAEQTTIVNLTVTAAPTAGFVFAPVTTTPYVVAGVFNSFALPITRNAGFTDSVSFSFSGAPTGLTIAGPSVTGTANSSSLTFTAAGDLPAGTYPVTVTARSANGAIQTSTLNIVVVRNNQSFGFAFVGPTSALSIAPGGSGSTTVTVVRVAPYATQAVFEATAPRGLTATIEPMRGAEGPLTLRVSADATVQPGTYTVVVQGATVFGPIPPVSVPVVITGATVATTTR